MQRWIVFVVLSFLSVARAQEPATQPVDLQQIKAAFPNQVVEKDGVLTLTLPRTDLNLSFDGYDVPSSVAASVIQFWYCPCGKLIMVGQFCVADYESNDVIDALREKNQAKIAAVAPMLVQERPRVLLIRFQGQGRAPQLIQLINSAREWMGENRMAPVKKGT